MAEEEEKFIEKVSYHGFTQFFKSDADFARGAVILDGIEFIHDWWALCIELW